MLTGTIINSLTILAGSAVGLVLRAVTRRSSKEVSADGLGGRLQTIIMQGMALCVLYIGVSGCLKGQNTLTAILSIALGAIIGELLDLDRRMRSLGDWVQTRTARLIHTEDGAPSISDGFVTASLLFCVGAMAIVGALENGLTGSYDTLKAKSIIDGISSIVFASSLGVGVAFSAGAIFLYQGGISLLAGLPRSHCYRHSLSLLIRSASMRTKASSSSVLLSWKKRRHCHSALYMITST